MLDKVTRNHDAEPVSNAGPSPNVALAANPNSSPPISSTLNAPDSTPLHSPSLGDSIYQLAADLFPINRSLTGPGVRATLDRLSQHIPLAIHSRPTGHQVYDWTVPNEWSCDAAYIENERGERVIDMANNNLHVLGYAIPVDTWLTRDELRAHVHTLPEQPELIPYRTSYYHQAWGFCMAHTQWQSLPPGRYHAVIKSTLEPGHLNWGEYIHRGDSTDEVLLSAHICHPSLANDNCSGLAVLATLAAGLIGRRTRLTYRFLFAPGTTGALCWLQQNERHLARIKAGLVVSCLGDDGGPTYKRSRQGDTAIDRAMTLALRDTHPDAILEDFSPYGYDERQYCSPGFNLPVGSLQRSKWGAFPEYHTSADNLDFVKPAALESSASLIAAVLDILDANWTPLSLCQKGEPQLGRRGLYASTGGDPKAPEKNMATLWTLNLADGTHTLADIANRSGLPFATIAAAAATLRTAGLLRPATSDAPPPPTSPTLDPNCT